MPALTLKPGREKSLLRRHPWIFSGAVERVDGNPESGVTVDLLSSKGDFLARAAYSPHSQIRARVWTFDPVEAVEVDFFRRRIRSAISARQLFFTAEYPSTTLRAGAESAEIIEISADSALSAVNKNAIRLIHAESDGIPGLIVDRYADTLVVQFLAAGAEFWRDTIADLLLELTGLQNIYERSDADVRDLEGLAPRVGPLRGTFHSSLVTIHEHGLQFNVDIQRGHKTGFYLDQRENRRRVRQLAAGRDVLDCFCYTGGFTVNALAGRARSVLSVDSSADALALCRENVSLNAPPSTLHPPPSTLHTTLEGDVFQLLRKFRDKARSFDLVILDPPKFAPTSAQVEKAARGYKDINLLAFKLLRPGGILVTFSCSGGVDAALFQKIVAGAALDAGVEAQILEYLSQAPDHPVALNFPEGAYLKGLVCRESRQSANAECG
ncbi:MAG: class I SAM-dependent methyltransferase [Chloroflexi bacterium]|nr:class I SAM-dependent methyltransferase [Chloroflexota bacterium]